MHYYRLYDRKTRWWYNDGNAVSVIFNLEKINEFHQDLDHKTNFQRNISGKCEKSRISLVFQFESKIKKKSNSLMVIANHAKPHLTILKGISGCFFLFSIQFLELIFKLFILIISYIFGIRIILFSLLPNDKSQNTNRFVHVYGTFITFMESIRETERERER